MNQSRDTSSQTESTTQRVIIKTDLIVPFKALEIYRDRIIKSLDGSIEVGYKDLKECNKHKNNSGWDIERARIESKIYWLKECKKRLYVSKFDLRQLHNREFYFTRELREPQKKSLAWRNQVLLRDDFECKKCKTSWSLEAHHIYSYKHEPDLRYDINNGITLCFDCHKQFHKLFGVYANMDDLISFLGVGI